MQYIGSMDSPWSSFASTIERLAELVQAKNGIEAVMKSLNSWLSDAIMFAMENGPTLVDKVSTNKKNCIMKNFLIIF